MTTGRAFTLIELLVVAAIATLVFTVSAISLSASANHASFARTRALFEGMDARGRMFARVGGRSVLLTIDPETRMVALTSGDEILAKQIVPIAIKVLVQTRDGRLQITFDRLGASDDYAMTLRDDSRAVQLSVSGLTGEIDEQEATP